MKYILGIDTSNYKTSIAVTDQDRNIICDLRRFLSVKQGERGLRQSDALFQHIKSLPELMKEMRTCFDGKIDAIACSSKPRPQEGSYMPVFMAGSSFARSAAAVMDVPLVEYSHQEGHVEAIRAYSPIRQTDRFLACHFSGGTCEVLEVSDTNLHKRETANSRSQTRSEHTAYTMDIIGGTKDISFGQVLDRVGVALGMDFPAGEQLDNMAQVFDKARATNKPQIISEGADMDTLNAALESCRLTAVKVQDGGLNLSGLDTQARTRIDRLGLIRDDRQGDTHICDDKQSNASKAWEHDPLKKLQAYALASEILTKISTAASEMIEQCADDTGLKQVLVAGGVASSQFIREHMTNKLSAKMITTVFGDESLSQDNAVGIALLGGKYLWD